MPSSTSSSDSSKLRQFAATFLATLLVWGWLAEAVGSERKFGPLQERSKALAGPGIPVVVVGDSRIHNAVSPEAMEETLGLRVQNYGWSGAGMGADLLRAAEAVTDGSPVRVIVLGVTPHSLTRKATRENAFTAWSSLSAGDLALSRVLGRPLAYFSPARPLQLLRMVRAAHGSRSIYSESGWAGVETARIEVRPSLEHNRGLYAHSRVSPEVERELLATVGRWRTQGIQVFGFWPPVAPEMRSLEDACSGIDRTRLESGFRAAGGTWLDFPESEYTCFDGSHLNADSARRFSRDLGRAIRSSL